MPKSKVRKKNDFTVNPVSRTPVKVKAGPSSVWFVVLFVGLMLFGLFWLLVFQLSATGLNAPTWLGWMAALAAACTAYVRVLGGSLGLVQSFRGPMAKQHRMALMTGACLLSPLFGTTGLLHLALILMVLGALITCGTRLKGIAAQLR